MKKAKKSWSKNYECWRLWYEPFLQKIVKTFCHRFRTIEEDIMVDNSENDTKQKSSQICFQGILKIGDQN